MSKRPSDVPQVPNPHPSSRVESGTDTGIEADTGLQGEGESKNGALAIADPSSVYLHPMQLKVLWNQLLMLMKKKT
eukprot:1774200-Ditylum_brightwellii.AAC.1